PAAGNSPGQRPTGTQTGRTAAAAPPGAVPRSPARPRPAPSASCSAPAAPAARPGTPGNPAAAPYVRTGHQTAPRTPPAGPAPPDTADVPSSRTPQQVMPLLPGITSAHYEVNKVPLDPCGARVLGCCECRCHCLA